MKKRMLTLITTLFTLTLGFGSLAGCGSAPNPNENVNGGGELASGGVLYLSVNPSIAVAYDENGMVTEISGRNDDGKIIVGNFDNYKGKETREVVAELVNAIGNAGYFVEEIEGEQRQIIIEIEKGSVLPDDTFLDEVVADVRDCVNNNNWNSPIDVEGETDYGITDYVDTDYGPDNDGVTDYDDTDYGPDNDGVTDYSPTPTPTKAPTPIPDNGDSNYSDSNYNDGNSNYSDSNYNDGSSNYNDGNSNYDDGDSGYDD